MGAGVNGDSSCPHCSVRKGSSFFIDFNSFLRKVGSGGECGSSPRKGGSGAECVKACEAVRGGSGAKLVVHRRAGWSLVRWSTCVRLPRISCVALGLYS